MPDIVFTCACRCAFQRYKRDGEALEAACPKCGETVTDAITPQGLKQSHLRLPGDQYDYISPQDGSHINSKRAHREHLKKYGMIEVGNEKPDLSKGLQVKIPTDALKSEMRNNLERMKSDGSWREI